MTSNRITSTTTPQVQAQQTERAARSEARQSEQARNEHSVHKGSVFRYTQAAGRNPMRSPPRPNGAQVKPRPRPRPQQAQRGAAAAQEPTGQAASNEDQSLDPDDHHDEARAAKRILEAGAKAGSGGDLGQQERRFTAGPGGSGPQRALSFAHAKPRDDRSQREQLRLLNSGVPGAALLFGRTLEPPLERELLAALAAAVLAGATRPRQSGDPTLVRTVLAGTQAQLARCPSEPARWSLRDVKALLLEQRPPGASREGQGAAPDERSGNALALLPLTLLNCSRPRTPAERATAQDRLSLLRASRAV